MTPQVKRHVGTSPTTKRDLSSCLSPLGCDFSRVELKFDTSNFIGPQMNALTNQ